MTEDGLIYHAAIGVAIVAAFYLLSRAARASLRFLGERIFTKTETVLDDRIAEVVLAHVKPLMVVTGLHIAVREVRKGAAGGLTAHQVLDYCDTLLYVVVVILVVKIILGIVREIIGWYLDSIGEHSENLKRGLGPLLHKAVSLVIGLVGLIVILDHFNINIGSLIVSLGVGSLAVALAAQDTLANMIAGFVILVDRPFRVGDRIELASGQVGDVQEIGLRSTTLLNFDANLIILPNSELIKSRITNYAYPHNQMRVVVKFGVAYGTEPSRVRSVLLALSGRHENLLKDPAPEVQCTAMNDSSVEFTLVARCIDFSKRAAEEAALREEAYSAFAKEGIEIPFPQRVIRMKT